MLYEFHVKRNCIVSYETVPPMPKIFTSKTQKTGEIGEDIACRYLKNKGFEIIERNYTKKWGEIDIVAIKSKKVHFVEVKSVSYETWLPTIMPEENMHGRKIKRFKRTIQTYLESRNVLYEFQADLLTVLFNQKDKTAKVELLENIC